MDERILEVARKIGRDRNIHVEVKKRGNSHCLYRSITKWDKEKKKRGKVSEYRRMDQRKRSCGEE